MEIIDKLRESEAQYNLANLFKNPQPNYSEILVWRIYHIK